MASLYKRGNVWWVKFRRGNLTVRCSTGCRIDSAPASARARGIRAQRELEEIDADHGPKQNSEWVLEFLRNRYSQSPLTLRRYTDAWNMLCTFGAGCRPAIRGVEDWTRDRIYEFLQWRQGKGGNSASHGTALMDLKVLRLILNEARARGRIARNPAENLRIARRAARLRPEISEEEDNKIRKLLEEPGRPSWMLVAYCIAMAQGCRLKETSLPFDRVDFGNLEITLEIKRGKFHTTALNPDLVPMFEKLVAEGRRTTWDWFPTASRDFGRFFRRNGLGHLCFHCTRVTAITRLARAGVNIQQAMRFVGHTQGNIHAIYQRLGAGDLSAAVAALRARGR